MEQRWRQDPIYAWKVDHKNASVSERIGASQFFYEKIVAQHPEMAITYKDVPDDQNGFLQWLEFEKRHQSTSLLFSDPGAVLGDPAGWDSGKANQWLEEHASIMPEIQALGLLPDQSVKGVEHPSFGIISSQLLRQCSDALLLQARVQAERGDSNGALKSMRAAMGLADHLDQTEAPTYLSATIGILIRQSARQTFFESLLPVLSLSSSELEIWEEALVSSPTSSTDLVTVIRGEWHASLRTIQLPMLFNDQKTKDPTSYVETFTGLCTLQMDECRVSDLLDLSDRLAAIQVNTRHLSKQSVTMLEMMTQDGGAASWAAGWSRAQVEAGLVSAAFQHLRGLPLPIEPLTGSSYVWDPTGGALSLPPDPRLDNLHIDPLVLPR